MITMKRTLTRSNNLRSGLNMEAIFALLIFLGVLNGLKGQVYSTGCPSGWFLHDDTCYMFVEDRKVYEEADAACWSTGTRLLSVDTFNEHKFISDFLAEKKLAREGYYYTSGYYFLGRLYWESEQRYHEGPSYWINNRKPPTEEKIYRVVYTYAGLDYKWTNISSSILASYICEIPRNQAQDLEIMNRDFDYGLGGTDTRYIQRGPKIVLQPESIIVFEGVETVELECSASGNPYPTYSWYRGHNYFAGTTNIKSAYDNRYTLTGGKFTIEGPESKHDLASYHCRSENEVGAVLSNQAKIMFGYLGYISNVEPEPLYATTFKGTKMNCETPSYSPKVNYQWFKNAANNIFVQPGNGNMFVSWSGALYVSEVQPTDSPKRYYCLITLIGTDDAKLGRANTLVRSNKGILLLLLSDGTSDNNYGPVLYTHVFPSPSLRGNTIRMECIAYGTHPLYYSWRREDGRKFVKGTVTSDRERVLTIKDAPLEADGNYICTCRRATGAQESKVITLAMESKPYFPYPITDTFADPGMTINWNCRAVARPTATYSWYKNGVLMQNSPGHIEVTGNVLTIHTVDKDRDEGMYQCAATNQHGTTFSTGQLKVLSFVPNFHRQPMPKMMLAPFSGNIIIPCHVEAAPRPEVAWLKNGANLNLVAGDRNGRIGMDLAFGLELTSIQFSDQGFYTCKATNVLGEASNSTQLNVMDGIVITQEPTATTVHVNRTAFLYCQAAFGHNYDIAYVWNFNGRVINYHMSSEYVNGRQNGLDGLYITNAQYKNMGTYECEVKTTLQTTRRSAFLLVQGPPGAPAGVYADDESITARSVRLIWTVRPELHHGDAITSYDIEAETNYLPGVWKVVASDIPDYITNNEASNNARREDQRASTVRDLIPNTSYRFRVRAINTFGRGQEGSRPSTMVKIQQTAPILAPRNVGGGGGKVGTLTISWDILDPSEHCGPNIRYFVYWKKVDDAKDWKRVIGDNHLALVDGELVITVGNDNYYLQYKVQVGAYNDNGHGPNSTEKYIFSAEGMPNSVPIQQDVEQYNATSVITYWEPVPDTRESMKGRVAGYRIHYYPDLHGEDPFSKEPDPTKNEILMKDVYGQTDHCQLIGLRPITEYYTRIQVFNGAGFGPKGEWRKSETYHHPLRDHPTHVAVYPRDTHSITVRWRGIGSHTGEESIEGYKLRVWKIQEDVRTATDTEVMKTNEAVVTGLQRHVVYVLRVLGYSLAGDGGLSEAVYFSITGGNARSLNIPVDPTTSEICFADEFRRTCGTEKLSVYNIIIYLTVVGLLTLHFVA